MNNNEEISKKENKDGQPDEELSVENKSDNSVDLESKLKETEEKLLRSLAETENQRRRFEKEIKDAFDFGGFNFAKETLAIFDNLERAKISINNDEVLKNNKDINKFLENINIIEKDLTSIFEKNKIKKIIAINKKFDPNLHQAMLEIEDDSAEPGIIIQEIQPGYMYGDRLLRPSFVGVAKEKSTKNSEKDEKKEAL